MCACVWKAFVLAERLATFGKGTKNSIESEVSMTAPIPASSGLYLGCEGLCLL